MAANKLKNIGEGIAGAVMIAASLLTPFLQSRCSKWGATDAEVWPWLVQIGQNRGGFYSYELLENMFGCKMCNADRIIPEFQHLEIGDSIPMHPKMGNPYKVTTIEPGRTLVLQTRVDTQTGNTFELTDKMPEKYQNSSWLFFFDEPDEGTTRLISRSRNDWSLGLGGALAVGIFESVSLIMDRKMLLGIKQRAEAMA